MPRKPAKKESAEEREARLQMMRFVDRVVDEIEEAGIKDEYAADDSAAHERASVRMTTSYGLRSTRRHTA